MFGKSLKTGFDRIIGRIRETIEKQKCLEIRKRRNAELTEDSDTCPSIEKIVKMARDLIPEIETCGSQERRSRRVKNHEKHLARIEKRIGDKCEKQLSRKLKKQNI